MKGGAVGEPSLPRVHHLLMERLDHVHTAGFEHVFLGPSAQHPLSLAQPTVQHSLLRQGLQHGRMTSLTPGGGAGEHGVWI